jgi:hypothetical protein
MQSKIGQLFAETFEIKWARVNSLKMIEIKDQLK